MNCDQVFDVLTRGPFPTGDRSDVAVEAHLSRCQECARLAEALRPALELFEEAVTEEESRTLPGYWGSLTDLHSDVTLVRIDPHRRTGHPRIRAAADKLTGPLASSPAWRMAAAVLLGFLAVTALRKLDWIEPQSVASGNASPHAAAHEATGPRLTRAGWQHIALLGMSRKCSSSALPLVPCEPAGGALLASSETGLNCCNACHAYAADPAAISHASTGKAMRACHECHAN